MLIDSIENIIFGGDFDCPLNPAVVKRGGNIFPRRSVIAAIEHLQSELDVHDIWRIKNPTTRSYTWSQPIFSRLDYCLTSNSLSDNVSSVYKKLPGLLLFIDFEKAFDSLELDYLNRCLTLFNFGHDLIR